ncbi:hypothetical protein [Mycobacterium avium]|uniref:Uncharacterized protein n=2 Tax=Mycobacterium avium TaxID=1764 RepID=A0A0H2ZXU0_MYCA1|nr:hypothetical protein [Mycobacterium avium]TXA41362.1 hypothetical protein DKM27_13320 [Mycobacterium tuberculosis variant bovis]ABK66810.1 conserved hypothetical protein [Mycobacterium avium 104]KBR54745.1 hypothetical protein X425_04793 [Mycobacterium avium XTB13-223]KDP05986.1 hypothetical protein MAV101_13745 [Mycobacterium avium subsp. hominissuis 101]MCA4760835.1 hypothetical protein [Mycobacterium avium subsp. hominissuis]
MDMATDQPATPPVTWAEAQPLLRPVLRPQSYANRLVNDGAQPWVRPVFPLINEMVVVDLPAVRAMVTPAETGAWGITGDQAFTVARENLTARQQILTPGEKYLLRDTDGDSYIDSMVLATGWLGSLAVPGGPRPLVFFPGDGSLVLGTDAPDGVAELFEVAEQLYLAAEQPVSPQGYTIAGAIIVPFDQAGPHPGRGLALSARSLLAATEYRHQTEYLREHYERERFPQQVAEARLIDTPWGRRTTTVWAQGSAWELPHTDYVTFATGDPSNAADTFTVPFPTVVDAVGLLPVAGISPVRYRADEWPAADVLAAFRAHAVDLPDR